MLGFHELKSMFNSKTGDTFGALRDDELEVKNVEVLNNLTNIDTRGATMCNIQVTDVFDNIRNSNHLDTSHRDTIVHGAVVDGGQVGDAGGGQVGDAGGGQVYGNGGGHVGGGQVYGNGGGAVYGGGGHGYGGAGAGAGGDGGTVDGGAGAGGDEIGRAHV